VLGLALSDQRRAALPAGVRELIEQHAAVEGTLEVHVEDHRAGTVVRYHLVTPRGRLSLHVAGDAPGRVTGERVRARGVLVGESLALSSDGASLQTVTVAPLAASRGEHRTLVILVNFQDNPVEPYTPALAHDAVFGTTNDFDLENSYQQTWLSGAVAGWFTLGMSGSVGDTTTLATLAKQAATGAGFNLSDYAHFVYAFPHNACSWWGLGSVGGNPSQAWVNGDLDRVVVAHEMGHNFGLYHSRWLDCGQSTIGPACTVDEYGDTVDVMGATSGHFNAYHKERLGWAGSDAAPAIQTVQSGGTYVIDPFEPLGGTKALKILKTPGAAVGQRTWYYVELRRGIGFDAFMGGNANLMNGIVVHTGSEANGNSSYPLDMTPETTSWYDPALTVGKTFTDADAGVTITPVSVGATSAMVSVTLAGTHCITAAPSVAMSPSAPAAVSAGTTVAYTVTVQNNDGGSCAASTFGLGASVPAGLTAALGSSSLALAPGASASTTLQVSSAAGKAAGTYPVTATVTDTATASRQASASASYVIAAPAAAPTMTVKTDTGSYAPGSAVYARATILNGTAPASGVSVGFKITGPTGRVTSASGVTGSTGIATYKFRTGRKDPVGSCSIVATASAGGTSLTAWAGFTLSR
jgi:hypothetical protein